MTKKRFMVASVMMFCSVASILGTNDVTLLLDNYYKKGAQLKVKKVAQPKLVAQSEVKIKRRLEDLEDEDSEQHSTMLPSPELIPKTRGIAPPPQPESECITLSLEDSEDEDSEQHSTMLPSAELIPKTKDGQPLEDSEDEDSEQYPPLMLSSPIPDWIVKIRGIAPPPQPKSKCMTMSLIRQFKPLIAQSKSVYMTLSPEYLEDEDPEDEDPKDFLNWRKHKLRQKLWQKSVKLKRRKRTLLTVNTRVELQKQQQMLVDLEQQKQKQQQMLVDLEQQKQKQQQKIVDLEQQKQKQQQKIADLDNLELILEQVESQLRKQWQGSLPPVQKAPYRFRFEGEIEEEELDQAVLNAVTVEQLLVNSGINYSPNKFRSEYSLGLKPNDVGVPFVNPADLMKSFSESASLLESVEGQKLHFSLGYPDSIHMKALKILAEEYNKGTENHKEFLAFLLLFKTRDTWHMAGNILSIYFYPKYALILSSDLIFSLDLIFSSDLLLSSDLILSSDFFLSLQKRIGRLGKIDGIFSILGSLKDEEAVGKVKSIILAEHSTRITTENFDEVRVKFDQLNLLAYAEKIREKIERLKQELVAIAIGK